MKNKFLLGGGIAAVIGIFTVGFKNCKRIKRWFKNDLHLHRMEVGCRVCESDKICKHCYYCIDCKPKHCEFCNKI